MWNCATFVVGGDAKWCKMYLLHNVNAPFDLYMYLFYKIVRMKYQLERFMMKLKLT